MTTATTSTPMARRRIRRKRPPVLTYAQILEAHSAMIGPPQTRPTRKGFMDGIKLPAGGKPRPGGWLDGFRLAAQRAPMIEGELAFVSVEGHEERRATLDARIFERLTANDPYGPWLTRTRWWLDDEGNMRAYSLHDARPFTHGVLVVAEILGAVEGETIEVPADPFDLRLSALRRLN